MINNLHPIPDGFEEVAVPDNWEPAGLPQPLAPPTPEVRARAEQKLAPEMKPAKDDPRVRLYDVPEGFEIIEPESPSVIGAGFDAARRGLVHGLEAAGEGLGIVGQGDFTGLHPDTPDRSQTGQLLSMPLAQGWSDPAWWSAQLAGGAAESAPSLAMGAFGGAVGGPLGAAGGFGLGAILQSLKRSYAGARAQGLNHDDATKQAILESGIAGVGGAAAGAAPGLSIFGRDAAGALQRPVGEALAQAFGVQPGIMAGQRAAENVVEGQPIGEGVPEAAVMGAAQGVPLIAGHALARGLPDMPDLPAALREGFTKTIPEPPEPSPFTYSRGPDMPWEPPMGGGTPELPPPPPPGMPAPESVPALARQEFETLPTPGIPGPLHGERPALPAPSTDAGQDAGQIARQEQAQQPGFPDVSSRQEAGQEPRQGRMSAADMLADIPGALRGGSVDVMRFASPPTTEEIDALIEAGRRHTDQEIDRIFGSDAERVKKLAHGPNAWKIDDIIFEKFGSYETPEGQEAGRAIFGYDNHPIVNPDSLQGLRDRLSNIEFAVYDAAAGDIAPLARELAWVAPKLPDIAAPENSHTEENRIAVLSLARGVEDMRDKGVDPEPVLRAAVEYTGHRTGGNADDASLLLERLAQYAAQFMPPAKRKAGTPKATPALPDVGSRRAPSAPEQIEQARARVNTEPSPAQIEAGNYRKAHIRNFDGFDITIENPKGSVRAGVDPDGKAWQTTMPADYGYIKGSLGADKDHVDVYLGESGPTGKAFVIDQQDPKTGKFDEHKVVLGAGSLGEALRIYNGGFSDGSAFSRVHGVSEVPVAELKKWLAKGKRSKPMAKEPAPIAMGGLAEKEAIDAGVLDRPEMGGGTIGGRGAEIAPPAPQPESVGAEQARGGEAQAESAPGEVERPAPAPPPAELQNSRATAAPPAPAKPAAAPVDREKVRSWAGRRLASLLGQPARESHLEMAEMILEAARTGKLNDIVRPQNKKSRQVFEEITGTKLPRTLKGTVQALKDGAPFAVSIPENAAPAIPAPVPIPESGFRPATPDEVEHAKDDRAARAVRAERFSPEAQARALERADAGGVTDEIIGRLSKGMTPEEIANDIWHKDDFWSKHRNFEWDNPNTFAAFVENVARAKGAPLDEPERLERWLDQWAMRNEPDLFAERVIKAILADPEQRAAVEAVMPEIADVVEGQTAASEAGEGDRGAARAGEEGADAGTPGGNTGERQKPARPRKDEAARLDDADANAEEVKPAPSPEVAKEPMMAKPAAAEGTEDGRSTLPPGDVGEARKPAPGGDVADRVQARDGAPEILDGEPSEDGRKARPGNDKGARARPDRPDARAGDREPESGNAADGREGAGRKGLADKGAGKSTEQRSPRDPRPKATRPDFHIADPDALIGGTPKVRFARNKAAIETFRTLQEEGRDPTAEELNALAGYIGWGSFGQELFQGNWGWKRPKAGWESEDAWLREHLGQSEWESAQRSIINAHYTDPPTVKTMWRMVERLGFKNGRVLEPSMGIGNFFGLMPLDMAAKSDRTGIELDALTGGMAKILYPNANVSIKGYQESATPDNFYDLVIGNWPFAAKGPSDRRYDALSPSLHDYFFLKALDQVRPGGVVMGITSAGTMDKVGRAVRIELAKKAKLLGAFRLPSGAFEKYAGTSVVTDIIVLRKREAPQAAGNERWIETVEVDTPAGEKVRVNQYFAENPSRILGTLNFGSGSTYGRPSMIVDRPTDLLERLEKLPDLLPEGGYTPIVRGKEPRFITNTTSDREGSVVVRDGGLFQVQGERLASLEDIGRYKVKSPATTAKREDQIKRLVEIRQAYGKLLEADRKGEDGADALRADLKAKYEAFRKAHKTGIADSDGLKVLRRVGDPFSASLAALERPDGSPSAIFTERTMRAPRATENPSVREAFVIARNERRALDIDRVAELSKRPVDDVVGELLGSKAIYRTPGGGYEVSDVYLSGNVRRKLREAQEAAERGEDVADSIAALKKVIPKDTPYFEIEAKLGAGWVPHSDYRTFIRHLIGRDGAGVNISFMNGSWKIRFEDKALNHIPEAITAWGHPQYRFDRLITAAFNSQAVKIFERDENGNRVLDEGASKEATEKATRIREEFSNWIWKDTERKVRLEHAYNEVNNAIAEATWDGGFLDFQGMALKRGDDPFSMRQHQVNAVWRGIANRRGLYAHEVGTGKTYTMGALAVESRRYGLARKPLILAHNANSATVAREIQEQYPGAQILYVENLSPESVKTTVARIANDDWDAVVLPHSLVDRIALSRETLMEIAQDQIAALEQEALEAAEEEAAGARLTIEMMDDPEEMKKVRSVTAKQLVHQRNKIIETINKLANRASRPDALKLEDTGIDMIIVDEAHEFKKPPIATKMQLRGLNKGTSNRSIALQFITSYVKKMNGGSGVHLFTGTPITNTLTEIYNMQRFIMDDQMRLDNLDAWDTWFNTFADATNDVELTATGEYEPVTRLAAFVNVAELRRMIGQYMDIVFADDMPEFKPRETKTGKTMADKLTQEEQDELLNGRTENPIGRPYKKIVNDVAPMGPAQKAIMELLVKRANTFKNASKRDRRKMLLAGDPEVPIRVETDAANASLDVRLFQDNARDEEQSKVNRAVANISKIYHSEPLATQAVFMERGFSDYGTRSVGAGEQKTKVKVDRFNLAKDMVAKLIAAGIPEDEIRIVDGSVSKEERMQIADMMNEGKVRVVIGLTQTLGIGVNMQRNLRAMHHMDAPWKPGDLEQRNGRGQRQGNKWNTVLEFRYITEGLDGRRWQVLAVKDRFIKAFLKADSDVRVIEGDAVSDDEGESANDLAETLSEAAGDPRLLMVQKLKADITKLEGRERLHAYGVYDSAEMEKRLRRTLEDLDEKDVSTAKDLEKFMSIKEGTFSAIIEGKKYEKRDEAGAALDNRLQRLPEVMLWTPSDVEVHGFKTVYKTDRITKQPVFAIEFAGGPREISKPTLGSIEGTLRQLPDNLRKIHERIEDTKRSIARMVEAQKQPFQQAGVLEKKRKMLADIESDLAMNPVPPPQWLRIGAPTGTFVYVDGKRRVVEGHRWTDDGYYVLTDEGPVPYLDVTDENGIRLYEEREFAAPVIGKKEQDEK